jgi:alanine dehydrogenase
MVRILTRSDVSSLISMADVIEAVEEAHADLARGLAAMPGREPAAPPQTDSLLIPMTAALSRHGIGGVKLLADVPANPSRGLPRQQSTLVLVSATNGRPLAFLDGGAITGIRTAAASAVATRHLARADSRVLGLIGAGAQARSHLIAIAQVRPIDTVLVWSRNEATARAFQNEMSETHGAMIRVVGNPEEVVRECDILCTLTPSKDPVVHGDWFTPGLHVNVVGAPPRPDHREVDTEAIRRARVVVDSVHTALTESRAVIIALGEDAITTDHISAELGSVIIGEEPGRTGEDEITLFNSVGVGIQDIAAAQLVFSRACEKDMGVEVDLAS